MARTTPDRDMPENTAFSGSGVFGPGRKVRTFAITAATLVAAVTSFAVSYAAVTQRRVPAQALRLWPGADAKAAQAARLLALPDRNGSHAKAQRLAREALLVNPMSVRAASTLAILDANAGQSARAERLLSYSERMSRRDLPTQVALIETRVQANDVPGALIHYDRALRASKTSEGILIPVLVDAVNGLDVARSLAPLLAVRPDWWKPFTLRMIQQDTTAPSSYTLLHALRLDMRRADERAMAEDAMQRMAGHGRVDLAARLYAELRPQQQAPSAQVHDGTFVRTDALAPFDWDVTDRADLSATVEARPDGKGNALFLTAINGASGIVARQLLLPPPGKYVLRLDIGDLPVSGARVTVAARCNGSDTPLTFVRPTPGAARRQIAMPIAVPASCRGLWIEFSTQAGETMDMTAPWIGAVRMSRGT